MKSKLFKIFLILAFIGCTFFYCAYMRSQIQIMSGQTMNTYYRITVRGGQNSTLLHNKIKDKLQQINSEMSVFENMSDLSQFNKNKDTGWIDIPEDLAGILKEAYRVYQQTNGYFDPSVGKLVDMWGFGTNKTYKIPTEEEIKEAKKSVGFNKITFSGDFRKARKTNPDVYLNLSAIAKGYAVDKVALLLKEEGYTDYVVEIGGEVKAKGKRSKKATGWNLGIAKPESGKVDSYEYIISLQNMAVATSGDYRNYFDNDGKRYSHTIDPKTGHPADHKLVSVTVFNKNCTRADAWATGLMSMGEVKGMALANANKLPVVMFIKTEDSYQTLVSNEAQKILEASLETPATTEEK